MGAPWLQRQRDLFRRRAGIRWAIVPSGSSASIGTVGLTLSRGEERIAELGVVVARPHWGKGLGTTAARMALRYGFFELGLSEIRAEVLQRNPASIRLLEKAGFKMIRVLPTAEEEPEVMILYSLTRPVESAA
jgi:ribosomal-protein-alanine N-acetyltransferase